MAPDIVVDADRGAGRRGAGGTGNAARVARDQAETEDEIAATVVIAGSSSQADRGHWRARRGSSAHQQPSSSRARARLLRWRHRSSCCASAGDRMRSRAGPRRHPTERFPSQRVPRGVARPARIREGRDEAVAAARNGADEARVVVVVVELDPQAPDMAIHDIAFGHEVGTQTASRYSSLATTRPARLASRYSRACSIRLRAVTDRPILISRLAMSTSISPTFTTVTKGRSAPVARRLSTSARASSSSGMNGIARMSSTPSSKARNLVARSPRGVRPRAGVKLLVRVFAVSRWWSNAVESSYSCRRPRGAAAIGPT